MSYLPEPDSNLVKGSLAWPFSPAAALFIVFAGAGFAMAGFLIRSFGPAGMVPGLMTLALLAIAVSRYLFLVLEKTTLGHKEPPLLSVNHFNPADDLRFFLVLTWLLLVAGSGLFADRAVTMILALLSLLLMPAALVLLAVNGKTVASVNPRRILKFMQRMGAGYAAMVGTALLMVAGLVAGIAGRPPLVAEILGLYLLVVAFHLQGRLAYTHRERLGFRPEKSPEIDQEQRDAAVEKSMQTALDRIHPLSAVHEYGQALAALETAIEELGAGDELVEAFSERILTWENPEVGLLHLQKRITAVLRNGQTETAWQLCQRGLAVTSRFHPATGDEAVLLTRHGFEAGAHRKALRLVMEFDERYPQLPELLPTAAILEARVLAEKLGRPEAARGRLRHLCQKHASCAASGELVEYLGVLDQAG